MKVGDKVWYGIPGDSPREWTITGIWDTNTVDGKVASLVRADDTKKREVDRCNALVSLLKEK